MTRQENPCNVKSVVGDLSLATVAFKAELEQPQVMDGGAQDGATAGHHTYKKFKLSEFDGDRIDFSQLKRGRQESMAADAAMALTPLELRELCRHHPKTDEVMVMN